MRVVIFDNIIMMVKEHVTYSFYILVMSTVDRHKESFLVL